LFVFQRTPSSVDERNNHKIDPDWFAETATPGWQQRWLDNFVENQGRGMPKEDLVDDGWTEISRRIREKLLSMPKEDWGPQAMLAAFEDADFEKMEQIRARVDAVVQDDETAQGLKAWYNQLCKRPCFHDDYLAAFNNPNAHLVHTDGKGVERITETGVVANGQLYEVDCIIYASGFEVGTDYTSRAGFDLKGREGIRLSEHWSHGMRTLHGMHVHGFPNAFIVQPNQAGNMISNVPHNILDHAKTIAHIISHAEAEGAVSVEPTQEAEQAWVELILSGEGTMLGSTECTPGYYNNEGKGWSQEFRQAQGHPGGPAGFFSHIDKWRQAGDFKGLRFSK
ncbi:MAG: monooxygenase, partial [Pseudomonadota bacterium]